MAAGEPKPRWIVLEPGLRDQAGHQRAFALALPAIAAARGMALSIYGGIPLADDIAARTSAVPLFRTTVIRRPYRDPLTAGLRRLIQSSQEMARDLLGPGNPHAGRDDIVLVPTADPWLLVAVGIWLSRIPKDARPRVAITFHEGEGLFAPPRSPTTLDQAQIRYGIATIEAAVPRERFLVTATNHPLAGKLSELLGRPVHWCPVGNPVEQFATDLPATARRSADGRPRIAIVGFPRYEKGQNLLRTIVAAIAHRLPGASIFVQVPDTPDAAPIPPARGLEVHRGALTDEEYRTAVVEAAIMVLPYRVRRYRGRVSGVFVDAAAAGCTMVVPAGTWMAERVRANRAVGVIFERNRASGVAEAAAAAVADIDRLSALAAAAAPRWRAAIGPGPYLDRITRLLRDLSATARGQAVDAA